MSEEVSEARAAQARDRVKLVLVGIVVAALLALTGCCMAFAADEAARAPYVPAQTTFEGEHDVTGLTAAELEGFLTEWVAREGVPTLTLTAGDKSYTIGLDEVGAVDIAGTVDQAFAPYRANVFARLFTRLSELAGGAPPHYDVGLVCAVDEERLAACVASVAERANGAPQNAGYAYDKATGGLVVTPPVRGVDMNVERTIAAVSQALGPEANGDPDRLSVEAVAFLTDAESDDPGQGIFVDTRKCRVKLYEGGEEVASYACTPGMSGYATPKGDFTLLYKDAAPTWYNPHSDWSEGMDETIPPGPSNPLGLRALAVSCGGGIFLHGTTNTGSLGYPGSHGCVRLSNKNIVELYDRVSEGIPIIIR